MKKLVEIMFNPSGLDSEKNYLGQVPDEKWHVLMTWTRDTEIIDESNRNIALVSLGGEIEGSVEIFRFGHWACGYVEYLCVASDSPVFKLAQSISEKLENYPILNEEDYSAREYEAANQLWSQMSHKERIEYIRDNRSQFECNFSELLANAKGKYFSGYASELIY